MMISDKKSDAVTLPQANDLAAAAELIASIVPKSPLVRSYGLSELLGCDVFLKLEMLSPVGSFKLRGAYFAMASAPSRAGVVTSSTGNHGQGVAYAGRLLGVPVDIFVPSNTIETKIRKMQGFGGRVRREGHDIDDSKALALAYAEQHSLPFIDDGENPSVIAGAATVGLEIAAESPDADFVIVPMASGSLASGIGIALRSRGAAATLLAVQSSGSPAMVESWNAGRAIERPADTIADCLVCRVPAALALRGIIEVVDDAILVDDAMILSAVKTLVTHAQLLAEPGSAATLAAAWTLRDKLRGKKIVLVMTGANIEPGVLERALRARSLTECV